MRSTFAGLTIASSGLFSAQRALDITGHNIANTNTKGYSRQRLNQVAQDPMNINGGQGQLGLGVKMQFISQVRDEMLDIKYRQEVNTLGEWEEKYNSLTQVESIFNEPSDTGIRKVMDNFFQGINSLTKDPSSPTTRAVFLQNAIGLAQNFNDMFQRFEKMVVDSNEEVEASVRAINSMASQIAKLNRQILESELDGSRANDLRDARNVLIDDLSKLADIEVKNIPINEGKMSTLTISIQGIPLVSNVDTNVLVLDTKKDHPLFTDGDSMSPKRLELQNIKVSNVKWESGSSLNQEKLGGAIGGQLQQRDGFKDEAKGVPYYMRFLSEFANEFASKLNTIHSAGVSLNQTAPSVPGLNLFEGDGASIFIGASAIKVNKVLLDNPTLLALGLGDGSPDNNKNALEMLNLRNDKTFKIEMSYPGPPASTVVLGEGTPEDVLKTMIASLGVDGQEAKRMFNNQQYLTEEVDSFRLSVSAVSQDEEMANMIKYQHAYNAAARMITTIDEMIDVIINRMGRVGL